MSRSVADEIETGGTCPRRAFLGAIETRQRSIRGSDAVGVDRRQGYRWFRGVGGKDPFTRPPRSDRFLSQEEWLRIPDLRLAWIRARGIADRLGRAPSTISRELDRDSTATGHYRPYAAEKQARARAKRPKARKLDLLELTIEVEVHLLQNWSPGQVRDDLARTFPSRPEMHLSHKTMYQSVFGPGRGHLRADLHKHFRTGRAIRRHRGEVRQASAL